MQGREPAIRDLLREGDDVLVQVLKDPIGTKGARLTTFITVPSRYLVLLPRGSGHRHVLAHRKRSGARAPEAGHGHDPAIRP